MQSSLILCFFFALVCSLLVAYFQYYYKEKRKIKVTGILFILKSTSIFLLFLLLINPEIKKTEIINIKPAISVLVDNSKSITFFNENSRIVNFLESLEQNNDIQNKFDFQRFSFSVDVKVLDSLTFNEPQTNISKAIIEIDKLKEGEIAPIILISDGNQTLGTDYEFLKPKQPIYPIIVGDTANYVDIKISQLNVNKYSFIKNKFPVEVILNYDGDENTTTQFTIANKDKIVFRKNIRFSKSNKSQTITANLISDKEGIQYYKVSVSKIKNEKNINNNFKTFSIEVINEQTKVLLLTSVLHPDLGALKKSIESNKQRSLEIINIDNFNGQINDYQLIILYQPNNKFKNVVAQINQNRNNYLLFTGSNTDWNFINRNKLGLTKSAISESENYGAVFNDNFLTFLQEDIGFNNFPPLKDKFGEVKISKSHQTLLHQNINGIETQQPQLITSDLNNQKVGVIFGEGIWRWRAASFLNSNSFENFDKFIGNLIQYLASNKKRNRLEVNAENIYPANSTINVSAFYTDKNYKFDARVSLELTVTNLKTKKKVKVPFSIVNNSFQTEIADLSSGNYEYKVTVLEQNISKTGQFIITEFEIENQFTNANMEKLEKLANNTGGKLFYVDQIDELTSELIKNKTFYTIQESKVKPQNLINWRWILFLVISLFTLEWFIRKYYGKI